MSTNRFEHRTDQIIRDQRNGVPAPMPRPSYEARMAQIAAIEEQRAEDARQERLWRAQQVMLIKENRDAAGEGTPFDETGLQLNLLQDFHEFADDHGFATATPLGGGISGYGIGAYIFGRRGRYEMRRPGHYHQTLALGTTAIQNVYLCNDETLRMATEAPIPVNPADINPDELFDPGTGVFQLASLPVVLRGADPAKPQAAPVQIGWRDQVDGLELPQSNRTVGAPRTDWIPAVYPTDRGSDVVTRPEVVTPRGSVWIHDEHFVRTSLEEMLTARSRQILGI